MKNVQKTFQAEINRSNRRKGFENLPWVYSAMATNAATSRAGHVPRVVGAVTISAALLKRLKRPDFVSPR